MNSRSTQPSAGQHLEHAVQEGEVAPVSTANQSSANLVPKIADSGTEGTQYR